MHFGIHVGLWRLSWSALKSSLKSPAIRCQPSAQTERRESRGGEFGMDGLTFVSLPQAKQAGLPWMLDDQGIGNQSVKQEVNVWPSAVLFMACFMRLGTLQDCNICNPSNCQKPAIELSLCDDRHLALKALEHMDSSTLPCQVCWETIPGNWSPTRYGFSDSLLGNISPGTQKSPFISPLGNFVDTATANRWGASCPCQVLINPIGWPAPPWRRWQLSPFSGAGLSGALRVTGSQLPSGFMVVLWEFMGVTCW